MPIPKPAKDETEKDFMSRCMADSVMRKEYADGEQRAGICHSQWQDHMGEMHKRSKGYAPKEGR